MSIAQQKQRVIILISIVVLAVALAFGTFAFENSQHSQPIPQTHSTQIQNDYVSHYH